MLLLDGRDATELGCQLRESFLFGGLGETFVHVGPFIVLTRRCGGQVLGGVADAFQFLEPELGMFLLVVSRLQEEGCDLLKAFLLGLGGEVCVLVASLGFAGESGFQVFLSLGSFVLVAHGLLFWG